MASKAMRTIALDTTQLIGCIPLLKLRACMLIDDTEYDICQLIGSSVDDSAAARIPAGVLDAMAGECARSNMHEAAHRCLKLALKSIQEDDMETASICWRKIFEVVPTSALLAECEALLRWVSRGGRTRRHWHRCRMQVNDIRLSAACVD
jgi:hypothetical protein